MKPFIWSNYEILFEYYKPKNICEIGTHNGRSALQFCREALKYNSKVNYTGYDLFDLATDENHIVERNGKGAGNLIKAKGFLDSLQKKNDNFTFKLFKGYTQDTLTPSVFDFVYIDAGHSYESVLHDYDKVKESKLIFFDDYNIEDVRRAVQDISETHYELILDCPRNKRRQAAIIKDFDPVRDKVIADIFL